MKLLSVNLARALWIFSIYELNPRGKNAGFALVKGLVDRYGFSRHRQLLRKWTKQKDCSFEKGDLRFHRESP